MIDSTEKDKEMDSSKPPAEEEPQANSLENTDASLETPATADTTGKSGDGVIDAVNPNAPTSPAAAVVNQKPKGLKGFLRRFNLYLLLFMFILIIGSGILIVAYFQSKKFAGTNAVKTQDLTQDTLREIAGSDATLGSNGQILNIQSSAIFAGRVLVREGLEIAGNLQIGGTTALTNITVSGSSQFGQVQISKDLSVAGDAAVQGNVTAKSLQISGGGSFSGGVTAPQLTTSSFQLNSDLVLTHHISAGGPTPSLAKGPALGGGGTASVSGSDTSGAITINVGSSAPAGCFVTITFASKFNSTPHVTLTPVGPNGGIIDYYVERNTSTFSVCDATTPPPGTSFGFDYFIVN